MLENFELAESDRQAVQDYLLQVEEKLNPKSNDPRAKQAQYQLQAIARDQRALEKQVQHNVDTFKPEPEANGIYEAEQCHEGDKEGDYVWANRLTGDRKYTDDVTINFYQEADYCRVVGFSRSRVLSVYDYSTNYCNIRNLLFHTDVEFQGPPEIVTCSYPPDDVMATCAIH